MKVRASQIGKTVNVAGTLEAARVAAQIEV